MFERDRLRTLGTILDDGLVPLFYTPDADVAERAAAALAEGGVRAIEYANRGPGAWKVFDALRTRISGYGVELGVGSVVDAATASLYVNLGTAFVVAPTFDAEIASLCNLHRVPYIPGAGSATEVARAEAAGSELVKIFPADLLGPAFVRALLGPRPGTRMLVSGGVAPTRESIEEWITAGASVLGIGSQLVPPSVGLDTDFARITTRTRQLIDWVAAARGRQR